MSGGSEVSSRYENTTTQPSVNTNSSRPDRLCRAASLEVTSVFNHWQDVERDPVLGIDLHVASGLP